MEQLLPAIKIKAMARMLFVLFTGDCFTNSITENRIRINSAKIDRPAINIGSEIVSKTNKIINSEPGKKNSLEMNPSFCKINLVPVLSDRQHDPLDLFSINTSGTIRVDFLSCICSC
jgi:hypothetical protein